MSNENKELLYKIQLLKTALIQERTKIEPLEEKINGLNKEVIKFHLESEEKDKELCKIKAQNNLLLSKIDQIDFKNYKKVADQEVAANIENEKRRNTISNPKKLVDLIEFKDKKRRKPLTSNEYEELIATLETQNNNFKTLLGEANSGMRQMKEKFQSIIANQLEQIKSLETENNLMKEENNKYSIQIIELSNINNSLQVENSIYETESSKLRTQVDYLRPLCEKLEEKVESLEKKEIQYKDDLEKHTQTNSVLANKLHELKTAILDESIRDVTFNAFKKELFNTVKLTLNFTRTVDGIFCLVIQYENKKEKKFINITNIDSIKIINAKENLIQIKYVGKDKLLKTKDYNLDQANTCEMFIKVYRDYCEKVSRKSNIFN